LNGDFILIGLSHVALLVPCVRKVSERLKELGFQVGPEAVHDGEGTKEIYIERSRTNSLLLVEPVKQGPYTRALEKRGAGVHHVAIDVGALEVFIDSISQSGWLLHPKSLHTIKQIRTAYLVRPGFPSMIEVEEKKEFLIQNPFVSKIQLPFEPSLDRLLPPVGLSEMVSRSREGTTKIWLDESEFCFSDFL
jgi:hypothetical protein